MSKLAPKRWTYVGDMRCPHCGRYTKTWTTGRSENVKILLGCGLCSIAFIKILGGQWLPAQEFWESYKRQLEAEAQVLMAK